MTGGQESIETLLRQVRSRRRLALLVDYLVVASSAGLFLLSITVFVSRITGRPSILSLATSALFALLLTFLARRWSRRRASDLDSAFLIDRKLELEDRFTTACSVIRDGRSDCVFEEALLEDTAGKIVEARAESLAPYRLKKWHAVAVCSLAILAAAWATPVRTTESLRDAEAQRTDIQAAGERLSQSAEEIERLVPVTAPAASLSREQAELGRALRASPASKAEALKKLGALADRIRARHAEVRETRADEIVNLAERRFQDAVEARPKVGIKTQQATSTDSAEASGAVKESVKNQTPASAPADPKLEAQAVAADARESKPASHPQTSARRNANRQRALGAPGASTQQGSHAVSAGAEASREAAASVTRNGLPKPEPRSTAQPDVNRPTAAGEAQASDAKPSQQSEQGKGDAPDSSNPGLKNLPAGAIPDTAIKEIAKTAPGMSAKLLEKAAQLKAGELSEQDIKRLAEAARALSKDLQQIAQSKELRDALEEMARQIKPEQLEQIARELAKHEGLKKEIEATARLLAENQQARELIAGLADTANQLKAQLRAGGEQQSIPDRNRLGPTTGALGAGAQGTGLEGSTDQARALSGNQQLRLTPGSGRDTRASGKLNPNGQGQYLFLQSRAGTQPARVPYSSAYPQYHREAERFVQRSQIPANMKTMVRDYFSAINPEEHK
ncbi:MAG TPA: hypothetical protein VKM94_12360 [Blastocatellia bacterium]|nr:hypothetical protein [Blastocatellia bacterium]